MIEGKLGFKYPYIDPEKCVNCGLCDINCPICSKCEKHTPMVVYSYKGTDSERLKSSSGGFFPLIANYFLDKGYYVSGVVFDDDFLTARYVLTCSADEIDAMRKSKYLEPDLNNVFQKIKVLLQSGERVLFVGLPCHVAGLMKYVKNKKNLVTIDLICFGAGSPKIYRESVLSFVHKNKLSIHELTKVDFRHKPFIDEEHTVIDLHFGKDVYTLKDKQFPYYYGFVNQLLLRESCYCCEYNSFDRISDLTIGDALGHGDALGESIIMCNTDKGVQIVDSLKINHTFVEMDNKGVEETRGRFVKRSKPTSYVKVSEYKNYNRLERTYLNPKWNPCHIRIVAKLRRYGSKAKRYIKRIIKP